MDPLVWSALLLLLGLALLFAEVFVPSGGVLGFLSIVSLVSGVIWAFYYRGPQAGFLFLVMTVVLAPVALVAAFRWWPKTPMGRRLLLDVPTSEEVLPDTPQRRALRQLVGKIGVAKSLMLPSGAVEIDGQAHQALSEGPAIEPGQRIRVIEVRGNRVLVRPVEDGEEEPPADDVLSRPIESLGIDASEDPLA